MYTYLRSHILTMVIEIMQIRVVLYKFVDSKEYDISIV